MLSHLEKRREMELTGDRALNSDWRFWLQARAMRPVQICRAVLQSFSDSKTFSSNSFMSRGDEEAVQIPPPPPANFKGSSEVVFVDPSGWLNIAAHLSRSSLIQVWINPEIL